MSYILDALRRAESERQRGQTPGLHAQPASAGPGPASRPRAWALGWVVLGLAVGLASAVALWLVRREAGSSAPAQPLVAAPAPAAPRASQPVPATPPAAAPLPLVVSLPATVAVAPTPAGSGNSSASPAPRPVPLQELTPEQRRELPALAVGGSIWSEAAANRFVIFNGQVVREGEVAAQGVVLERIEPRAALLRWRGLLLELPL
jgi:general secretion pathway protein B